MGSVWFEDDGFLDALVGLILRDRTFLRQYGGILEADDFKARTEATHSADRWIIASKALDHWTKYREPAGRLIIPELKHYSKIARLNEKKALKLVKLARGYVASSAAPAPIADKVREFKQQVLKANALDQILELQTAGMLDDEKWSKLTHGAILDVQDGTQTVDYFNTLQDRQLRRMRGQSVRYPFLLIEPFDMMVRAIARGHLGLVMAPWKGRKSLFLLWIALAYCRQGLRVLHYTLEDPLEDVEDRLDAMITEVPIKLLVDKSVVVQKRFPRFKRFVQANLKLHDFTSGGLSIAQIQADIDRYRENKFYPDAVIIDYDDEIMPSKRNKERRFEFAEIYRDMRRLAAHNDILVWSAAQTTRDSEGKKIITGSDLAEDVSKARKVSLAIGIGASDWGEKANYLYVAAHKHDHMHVGCNIVGDPERMIFYDHAKTMRMSKKSVDKKP